MLREDLLRRRRDHVQDVPAAVEWVPVNFLVDALHYCLLVCSIYLFCKLFCRDHDFDLIKFVAVLLFDGNVRLPTFLRDVVFTMVSLNSPQPVPERGEVLDERTKIHHGFCSGIWDVSNRYRAGLRSYTSIPAMITTKCDYHASKLKEGDLLEFHLKTAQSQAYVGSYRRSKDGSPTCSSQ